MATILEEVPGAMERPGGCRVQVLEESDGSVTINIPPRRANPVIVLASLVLSVNLLLVLYTGLIALLFHHSVLFMAQISPQDLPYSLRGYTLWLLLVLLGLVFVGFLAVAIILRPLFLRETLRLGRETIEQQKRVCRRAEVKEFVRADARGFHLTRYSQGLSPSVLTVQFRGEEIAVAETASEADREWLASVGNALLRR